MLILTGNSIVNMEQVFCLSVINSPVGAKKEYWLTACHNRTDTDGSDSIIIQFYKTEKEAYAVLEKIASAYAAGEKLLDLRNK